MASLNVTLNGAAGGQGTSTMAAVLALYAAEHVDAQLVAVDPLATAALLGIPEPADTFAPVVADLCLAAVPCGTPTVRIGDAGAGTPSAGEDGVRLTVLRGPCYAALRSLVLADELADGIVVLLEPGRSLTARDVEDAAGVPVVATVQVTAAVARVVDAGLLLGRYRRLSELAALRRYAFELLQPLATIGTSNPPSAPSPVTATDLNEISAQTSPKQTTDLPVAQSATG